MEMTSLRNEVSGMISKGVGRTYLDSQLMEHLIDEFRSGLPELMPLEEKAHQYLLFTGAVLRDFFRGDDVLVVQSLYGFTTNFWRASSAVIETLVLHKKLPSQKLAVYVVMPGDVDDCEKAILHHARMLHEDFTPDFSYVLIGLFRQPIGDTQHLQNKKILKSRLWLAGDYTVGEVIGDTHRLYLAAWGMSMASPDLQPIA